MPDLEPDLNGFYEAHGEPEQTAKTLLSDLQKALKQRLPALRAEFMASMAQLREATDR